MDRYIGKKLEGRYEIQELIGVGGMANVYKAYDVVDDKIVAVKILKDEYAENEEFIKRFKTESKAIAVLAHPNIVKVYDVTFTDRIQSIVMEYVDGITLKEYIEQQKVLKWKEAVHFTVQILRALQHAHDKGIVHRDIKPQNIMLQQDGTIKVMDFGIARFNHSEPITQTDKVIGSVHYISPEQARGEITDEKTDVYAVGVMLYEMLTGELPFEAEDPVSIAMKQIADKPRLPREVNPAIPEGLEDITIRAMEKDVAKRYQTASEMLRDIEEFKKNPHIQFEYKYLSNESPTIYMEAINKSKHKQQDAQEEAATPEKKKSPTMLILAGVASVLVVAFIVVLFVVLNSMGVFGGRSGDILVPDLVGKNILEIKQNPEYAKIKFEETTQYSDKDVNIIIEQDPKAVDGRKMKADGTMKVTVSLGIKTEEIPDVYDMDSSTAIAALKKKGFEAREIPITSEKKAGTVVKTSPERLEQAPQGSTVDLYVSAGEEVKYAVVPDVTGWTYDEAKQELTAKGFEVAAPVEQDSDKATNIVLSQTPAKDSQQKIGTKITLNVSSGHRPAKDVTVEVKLPTYITKEVTFKAFLDGSMVKQLLCYPNDAKTWSLSFTGSSGKRELKIRMEDQLYQTIEVNFDTGSATVTQTNTVKIDEPSSKPIESSSGNQSGGNASGTGISRGPGVSAIPAPSRD